MANRNNKIKLLCDTNQMAYGSSSALLAILEYMPSFNTAFTWGVTEKILTGSKLIDETIKINNKDAKLIKKSVDFSKFDAVLVMSNATNLNTYLDLEIAVFYVDIHFWYPSDKSHRVWQEAKQCFIERYFIDKIKLPNNSIEVGPIISLPKENYKVKKQALINIGGGANQFISPGVNSRYINIVVELILQLKAEKVFENYKFILAGGEASINSVKKHKYSKEFILKSYSKNEFLETLSKSEYLFTSPGQYATFEGLYLEKKMILLPPQNASQIIQISILENAGLVKNGLNLTDYFPDFKSLNNRHVNEGELTKEVLNAIDKLENDSISKSKIVAHLIEQVELTLKPTYLKNQKTYADILGLPGAEPIAAHINEYFKSKHILSLGDKNLSSNKSIKLDGVSEDDLKDYFPSSLYKLETLLFERIWSNNENTQEVQNAVDIICRKYEGSLPARDMKIRLACTTTDSDGAIQRMVESLVEELAISQWNSKKEGPLFEVLVIENSMDAAIATANQLFCIAFSHEKISIRYIPWKEKDRFNKKPYSIVESRIYLIEGLKRLGWHASKSAPIWILDDDFELNMTIPDKAHHTKELRVGSVLHRIECLINEGTSDAIVGGNTGSFPIPELSTVRLQLKDLLEFLNHSSKKDWENTLVQIKNASNYYYDLSRERHNYFSVIPDSWKNDSISQETFLNDIFYRLLSGSPTSRPLYANYVNVDESMSAWEVNDESIVSGGNTLYVNDELLSTSEYYALNYKGIISRRSDAIWFLRYHQKGYSIKKKNLSITHNRKSRDRKINKESVQTKALSDVLGVGFWEAIKEQSPNQVSEIDIVLIINKIKTRLLRYNENIALARIVLLDIEKVIPKVNDIPYFSLLKEILSESLTLFDDEEIKIVNYGNSI